MKSIKHLPHTHRVYKKKKKGGSQHYWVGRKSSRLGFKKSNSLTYAKITHRTRTILSEKDILAIKKLIEDKARGMRIKEKVVYASPIDVGRDNEIPEKTKGSVNAYLWGKKIHRGYIGVNISVINGYKDPLFNNEGVVKIYYEIFPSAKHNPRSSRIFDTFKTEQRTLTAKNMIETKRAISIIFKRFKGRK